MVFAIFGIFIGIAIGVAIGIYAGSKFLLKYFEQVDVKHLDIRADYDEKMPFPDLEGKPVPKRFRNFIPFVPAWVTMPDFYRVSWMNHMLKTLWPHYNQAIGKMVLETAEPQIEDLKNQYPFIDAIDIELIDFGTKPLRVGGVKVYNSSDDQVVVECPLFWGSNARVRASARLHLSKWSFYVPLEICDIQMKVQSRMTLRPLVDTLPCVGAVNITLLEAPYFDFSLHLFRKFDWMLLPGLNHLTRWIISGVIGDLLQYPNSMSMDIMEGGGVPPPPVGLLQVKILKVDKITSGGDLLSKVDPYIEVGVRERTQRTKTVWNNKHPDFQEVFNLIVDDPDTQQITFKLHDDDLGFNDPVIGIAESPLAESQAIKKPKTRVPLTVDFIYPPALKKMKRLVKKSSKREMKPGELKEVGVDEQGRKQYKIPDAPPEKKAEAEAAGKKHTVGTMHVEVIYVPFKDARNLSGDRKNDGDDEDFEEEKKEKAKRRTSGNIVKVTDEDKGILTVTLTGCSNLEAPDGSVDPYVELRLEDPKTVRPEVQKSTAMTNEAFPHWNQKFDFAMISATSVLNVRVFDKKSSFQRFTKAITSPVDAVANKIQGTQQQRDEPIGALRLKIKDVVRNERIKDVWALQQTQKGEVSLTLEWNPIELDALDEPLDEPGDQREVELYHKKQKEQEEKEKSGDKGGKGREKHGLFHGHRHKTKDTGPHEGESAEPSAEPSTSHAPEPTQTASPPTASPPTASPPTSGRESQSGDKSPKVEKSGGSLSKKLHLPFGRNKKVEYE